MIRLLLVLGALLGLGGLARAADEDISIRGNFPQLLARGETTVQMANRIAILIAPLDQRIAPPCGMKRIFEFSGADYVDLNDVSRRAETGRPSGVWRFLIVGKGCWSPRRHNVFVFDRGAKPAELRLGVPGASSAGVKHQQDATQIVLREANRAAAQTECDERAFIVDTVVNHARKAGQSWDETWTTSACEVPRKWLVMFKPEADKMRISVIPTS
jgi:hypothetical protein